jgi:hypothetical protein
VIFPQGAAKAATDERRIEKARKARAFLKIKRNTAQLFPGI